jgi:hypothetical protein
MTRTILIEQATDDGYDAAEVCEFRLPGDGTVELVTGDGYERLAFPASVAADTEELARLVCEEVADGDTSIFDPDKPVILTER